MSEMGQSRRLGCLGMSALPPTPDVSLQGSELTLRAKGGSAGSLPMMECSALMCLCRGRRSHCGAQAPIYNNLLRGDVRRGIRCQENSGSGEIARFSPPAKRHSIIYPRDKFLIRYERSR